MASSTTRKIFVSRLRWTDCADTLRKYFSKFGKVNYANVVFDRETGWSKNYGFVTMDNEESTKQILDHRPHMLKDDQEIHVAPHTSRTERYGGRQDTASKAVPRSVNPPSQETQDNL